VPIFIGHGAPLVAAPRIASASFWPTGCGGRRARDRGQPAPVPRRSPL